MGHIRQAVGAIIKQEQDYILVHKVKLMDGPQGPEHIAGIWDFPKGGVKQGEALLDAVIREIREETGAQHFRIIRQFDEKICFAFNVHLSQETTMFLVEYTGNRFEVHPQDEEIDDVQFFVASEVCNYLTHQETKDFFMKMLRDTSI